GKKARGADGSARKSERTALARPMRAKVRRSPRKTHTRGYVHAFTRDEQDRLYHQARFLEQRVHEGLPLWRARNLIEIGCGVGAQTDILLRRYPDVRITGVDASKTNLERARRHLRALPWAKDRAVFEPGDAGALRFAADTFDAAFLCWILEHVADPLLVLSEA